MRIMTDRAGLSLDGITSMRLLEGVLPFVVAGKTDRRLGSLQKVLLCRTVSEVAGAAPLALKYFMDDRLLIFLFLVALETGLVALCGQEVFCLRGMGVMALCAFARLEGGMDVFLVHADLFGLVAVEAELIALLLH